MLQIPLLKDLIGRVARPRTVHDSIDYLNYFVSTSLLFLFALLTSGLQYFGRPIKCWVPYEFRGGWEKYAEDYCFIQSTYFVPFSEEIPNERNGHISYYRWVPIVLALQAVLFSLPNEIWNILIKKTKFDPKLIVAEARKLHNTELWNRTEDIANLAELVEDSLHNSVHRQRSDAFQFGDWEIVLLYCFIKVLSLANVITQLILLDKFLGNNDLFWGFQLIDNLTRGRDWQTSALFPRVVLCDFQVREMGNLQQHTIQCVIGMNLLNEKIYLILWCWFLLVTVSTTFNLLNFVRNYFVPSWRRRLVLDYLPRRERKNYSEKELECFADCFLGPNGILLLSFISNHAGDRVARDLVGQLFTDYAIGFLASFKNFLHHELSFREHVTVSQTTSSVSNAVANNVNLARSSTSSYVSVPKMIVNGGPLCA